MWGLEWERGGKGYLVRGVSDRIMFFVIGEV